jgi:hypothetical protein
MLVHVTRDDVCAYDDAKDLHLDLPEVWSTESLVDLVWRSSNLPKIDGGKATWVLSSGIPLAVVAQEWAGPISSRHMHLPCIGLNELERRNGEFRMHWTYFTQHDPRIVLEVVQALQWRPSH